MKLKTRTKFAQGSAVVFALLLALCLTVGCAGQSSDEQAPAADTPADTQTQGSDANSEEQTADDESSSDKVADSSEMTTVEDVVDESMTPVFADQLNDGTYPITVDSSSSMFRITSCELTVANGSMTAVMTMGGKGYLYVYMGTAEEAAKASESDYIPFEENSHGNHTFTVPVEALDSGIDCAAFSKNKEKWYARTLVFEASSLPATAFKAGAATPADSLGLADGTYSVDVTMAGGTGRSSIESPTTLTVDGGKVTAKIVWSSPNYDYMIVDGTRYDPINSEGNSTFEIPVEMFDSGMTVIADTTAMSQPYEIEYTLNFNSASIKEA